MSEKKKNTQRKPHTIVAFLSIIIMCVSLVLLMFASEAGDAIQVVVFLFVVLIGIIGLIYGCTFEDMEKSVYESLSRGSGAVLILILIGILVGSWLAAGTIPTLIYYGLQIISPSIFLFTACLVCGIGSVATGSSWTTGATFGTAIFGIGIAMGIPAPMIVGAIISGSYFGDKMSPLSETTNLASAVTGVNIFTHIRSMMYSSGITMTFALLLYLVLGFQYSGTVGADQLATISEMLGGLDANFNLGLITLIPPILVVVLAIKKVPALVVLSISIVTALLIAVLYQGYNVGDVLLFMKNGFSIDSGIDSVDALLTRGGYESMWWVVSFTMITLALGGLLEETKILEVILDKLGSLSKTPATLILIHSITSICVTIGTTSQVLAIVLPGRMYLKAYEKLKIKPEVCSRVCEDSGTIASVLVPWGGCALYFYGLFGVAPVESMIYSFFIWGSPVVTVILGFTDKFIFRYSDEEYAALQAKNASEHN